jgi:uncharacterized protein YfdQ (DUF2303 family)
MDGESMKELLDTVKSSVGFTKFNDEHGMVVVPEGFSVKDIRDMMPPPPRPRESIELLTAQSFCDYVTRFGAVERTVVFADEVAGQFKAVLDYHTSPGDRGTCEHSATYRCPHSEEWKIWNASSGKLMAQTEFARFIENNLPDIIHPPAADMLQISLTLQIKKDANYASDLRLDNGQTQFRYEETIRGTTKAGDLAIPDTFTIGIPALVGEARQNVVARLRYRIQDQKLVIGYELVRPQMIQLAAVQSVTTTIKTQLAGYPVYIGKR